MIPFSNTITAQTIIVLSISIPTFIAINVVGIQNHFFNIFYLLLPAGAPLALIPVIAFLEGFSYLIRVVSLTLRLFANMLSGHVLMKIILYAIISLPFLSILLLPIVLLELMVAAIQAYVFLTLTLSYYQDVFLPH
jgi:ATP synthase subunit 6